MNDLLTDWYFTRCINLKHEQASALLVDLQRLQLDTLEAAQHASAVRRIAVDHRIGVYVIPALLDVVVRNVSDETAAVAAIAVSTIASDGVERNVNAAVVDLVDLVRTVASGQELSGREVRGAVDGLDVIAAAAAERVLIAEHTPYFGLSSQQLHVVLLTLAKHLARDQGVASALSAGLSSVVGEQPEGVLAEVVTSAATGRAGRLPLRLAAELVVTSVDSSAGLRFLATAHLAGDGASSFEPDLLQTAAWLQPDADSLLDEVLYGRGLTAFLRGEAADTRPTSAVVRRLGITSNEGIVLRAQIWQSTTVSRIIAQPVRYAADIETLLATRPKPSLLNVAPPRRGDRDWAQLASALADVSGGRWRLATDDRGRKAVSTRTAAMVVGSPWPTAREEKGTLRYPTLGRLSGVLRLALPAVAAVKELSRPEIAGDETQAQTRATLAGLMLVADTTLDSGLWRVWFSLVVAARSIIEELTVGHVGSVSPEALYDWIDVVADKLEDGRQGPIGERMGEAVVARPLAWADAILPHLDEAGPHRWEREMVGLVEFEAESGSAMDIRAVVLNDILRRFGRPYSRKAMPAQQAWQKMYRQPASHHAILLSPTTSLEEWLLVGRKKLSAASAAALAIRRLEAMGAGDHPLAAATFAELSDAMAVVLRQRDRARDHFHVVVRAVALLEHPAVRESTARVEQVAALGIVSDEPAIWRYVFDQALGYEAPLGDEEGTIRRLLAGALGRLLSMERGDATTRRLRTIWRTAFKRLMLVTPQDERHDVRKLLVEAADLHGTSAAGMPAVARAVAQVGLTRRGLRVSEPGVAGAAWLTQALVLDPINDAHQALIDGRDTLKVSGHFPPSRRSHYSLATVVGISENDGRESVVLNVGERALWSVPTAGRVPATETLRAGEPVIAVLKEDKRSFRMLQSEPAPGLPTKVRLEAHRVPAEATGRTLRIRVPGKSAVELDHGYWDADTSRAFATGSHGTAHVVAVYDEVQEDWLPFVRDGLALVVAMAAAQGPTTLVFNTESIDGWIFSVAPGEVFALHRSDLTTEAVAVLEDTLSAYDDPNGLLVTFALGSDLALELWEGEHETEIHGSVACPADDRNLRWRRVVDEHLGGTLLSPREGVWELPVAAPATPFPSAIVLEVQPSGRGRRKPYEEAKFIAPDEFDARAQRTGHLRARVEPAYSLGADPAAVFAEFFAPEEVAVDLSNVISYTADGWVMCSTTNGIVVMLRPESISLLPLDPASIRALGVRGRKARLGPLRSVQQDAWTTVSDASASLLRPVLDGVSDPITGLVWSVRRGPRTGGPVAVRFNVDNYPEVAIELGARNVRTGSIVKIRRGPQPGSVEVSVGNAFRVGDLLFPDLAHGEPIDECVYVGQTSMGSATIGVVQSHEGAVLMTDVPKDTPLFSVHRNGQWTSPRRGWELSCRVERGAEGGRLKWVSVSGDGGAIGGVVTKELTVGPAAIRRARIIVRRRLGQVVLGRELDIVNVRKQRTPNRPPERSRLDLDTPSTAGIAAEIDRLADLGRPVEVEVDMQDLSHAYVAELLQLGCSRTESALPVLDPEPVLVSSAGYEPAGIARLVPISTESYGLSFRDVPDLDVEALAAHLGAPYDEEVRPGRLLYAMEKQGRHVFEFGFGLRASAKGAQLRFDDRPFNDVKEVLFHGDVIGSVVFTRVDGDTVMVIREASITASAGTTLYRQATQLKFLHLLRVEEKRGALRIRQVEGFNSRAHADESLTFFGPQIARATLEPGALGLRLPEGASRLIYGELDTQRFLDSSGLQLAFYHRTLTKEGLAAIGHSVVTFVTGGPIVKLGNELGLKMRSASDQSQDLDAKVYVTRRNFSANVNQLARLQYLKGDRALSESLLVGWVREDPHQRAGVAVSLCAPAIPARSTRSLRDLARELDGVFLLVDELSGSRFTTTIRLEYRHGIYFRVRSDEVESWPDDLARQDVVRLTVEPDTGMFTLNRCSVSDRRFFKAAPRPMVALPANRLLAKSAPPDSLVEGYWTRVRSGIAFIAGGLPDEMAAPASYARPGGWGAPKPKQLTALMRKPHPKIGLFGVRNDKLQVAPAIGGTGVGALAFDKEDRITATVDGEDVHVDPSLLTFGDIAASELRKRAHTVSWRYHDDGTGGWQPDDTVQLQPLGAHTAGAGGPVFFERGERLRYTTDLDRWAYSSAFLSHGLRREGAPFHTAVAGISRTADGSPDGLYLEITPGLVCLVLGALLGIRLPGGRVVALDDISMGSFGIGDQLDIVLVRDSERSVDSVHLVRWDASGRGLAGIDCRRLVLPVEQFDDRIGRLRLGAGDVHVHIPTWNSPPASTVALTPANDISDAGGACRSGDSVLLVVEDGKLAVAGLQGVKPYTRADTWAEDRWHGHLFKNGQFIGPRLKNEVIGAGGAMAVTVEHFNAERSALLFSFRRQFKSVVAGRPMLGQVVGSDGYFLLVRLASAIVRVRADRVVSGVPNQAIAAVATTLRAVRTPVWLTDDGSGFSGPQLAGAPGGDRFLAEADVDIDGMTGIVARHVGTNGLAWVPEELQALTTLDREERRALWFTSEVAPFLAVPRVLSRDYSDTQTPVASILDVPALVKERSLLRRGLTLGVTVRSGVDTEDGRRIVAETHAGMIIELRCLEPDEAEVGEQLNVEVSAINAGGTQVVAVPVGERRLELLLPLRLIEHVPPPGEHRATFAQLLDLLNEQPPDDLAALEASAPDERLARSFVAVAGGRVSALAAFYAADWWRDQRPEDEVDLLPALLAVHLLLSASSAPTASLLADSGTDDKSVLRDSQERWEFLASEVLASLGRRALRSLHVEALMRYWLEQRHAHEGFAWRQWESIIRAAGQPLMPKTEAIIEPTLRQLDFGGGSEGRRVAAAVRMACGSSQGVGLLLDDRDLLLPELVRNVRIADPALRVFRGRRADGVLKVQLAYLDRTIARIRSNGNDVILLPEPPWFG